MRSFLYTAKQRGTASGSILVGLPRPAAGPGELRKWTAFFTNLGCDVLPTPATGRRIYLKGGCRCGSAACLHERVTAGHILTLLESGRLGAADFIFVPGMPAAGGGGLCPNHGHFPESLAAKGDSTEIIGPAPGHVGGAELLEAVAEKLKIGEQAVRKAYREAFGPSRRHEMEAAAETHIPAEPFVAVVGRPCMLSDSYLNLNLFSSLRGHGIPSVTVGVPESAAELLRRCGGQRPAGVICLLPAACTDGRIDSGHLESLVKELGGGIPFLPFTIDGAALRAGGHGWFDAFARDLKR